MKSSAAGIEKALSLLAATPVQLAALTARLTESRLRAAPDGKSWSAAEILAHLRACSDLWTHSIYAMLAEQDPVLPDINERKWAGAARYLESPFADSLQIFAMQRTELLRVLHGLEPGDWERPAEIFGRRHAVFSQARRMAIHEDEHCVQLKALLPA